MKRPNCSNDFRPYTGNPCTNKAKFYVTPSACPDEKTPVCGVCARIYIAEALHPLRMKDWNKWYK
jgi:hypothetical protein